MGMQRMFCCAIKHRNAACATTQTRANNRQQRIARRSFLIDDVPLCADVQKIAISIADRLVSAGIVSSPDSDTMEMFAAVSQSLAEIVTSLEVNIWQGRNLDKINLQHFRQSLA